jgi:hypothetical protein
MSFFREAVAVTPHDANDLDRNAQSLYVGGLGNVSVHMVRQDDPDLPIAVTFLAVPAGTVLPISVSRVLATGTTASNIIALRS